MDPSWQWADPINWHQEGLQQSALENFNYLSIMKEKHSMANLVNARTGEVFAVRRTLTHTALPLAMQSGSGAGPRRRRGSLHIRQIRRSGGWQKKHVTGESKQNG